jgi:fatty-acyl-CoA synthase
VSPEALAVPNSNPHRGLTERLLPDLISANLRIWPDGPAIIFEGRTHSWRDFAARVDGLRRGLYAAGLRAGHRVAVLDRNSDEYIFLHYALAASGAVIVPVNMWLRTAEIAYILGEAEAQFLMVGAEFRDGALAALAELERKPRIIARGWNANDELTFEAVADGPEAELSEPASWDDIHMILFTSGTTGRPKGAMISHRRTILDALATSAALGVRRTDRMFCYLPLFHTGAWDYFKLFFLNGGSIVLAPAFEPEAAIDAIERHRCTMLFGVPVVLRQIIEEARWNGADMSSVRLLGYGSYDPSDFLQRVLDQFRDRGAKDIQVFFPYGLTEAGPFLAISRPGDPMEQSDSVGTPVAGVTIAILDDADCPLAVGEVGEICARSAAMMSGYLNRPDDTAEAFRGGWLHTGDLGRFDAEGRLYLVDRKKDMIRTGGENVYAKEVEQVLVGHEDVMECAVVGLPDLDYGEKVIAAIVPREGAARDPDALKAYVRARIAGFKTPREIHFLDALPKSSVGKISKVDLRLMLQANPR